MKTAAMLLMSLILINGGQKDIFSNKSIEQRMVKVSDRLYANKYETSNEEYREFLDWVKTNEPELLEKVNVDTTGWKAVLREAYGEKYFSHEGFNKYPVVNISYEGAVKFCEWLSEQYNNKSKRKYQQVVFRLPSPEEWMKMATNGRKTPPIYPWGAPYLKNSKGKYQANFFAIGDQQIKLDINDRSNVKLEGILLDNNGNSVYGRTNMTAPVDSYIATGAGLHNLSGNAAEMLSEKGKTKGGSWGSSGYYLRLDAEDEFEGFTTSPYVGFRYVMEVIED